MVFLCTNIYSVILLRNRQPELNRPYKVPLYPVVPLIAIAGGLFVVINQLLFAGIENTVISLGGVLITLIGLPLYSIAQKQSDKDDDNKVA